MFHTTKMAASTCLKRVANSQGLQCSPARSIMLLHWAMEARVSTTARSRVSTGGPGQL